MWFSGLRGAIAYALSLHLEFKEETRKVLVTTTLVVVLFTTIILGGGTMPLMKYLERWKKSSSRRSRRRGRKKEITMSKTRELGTTIESEHLSEITEEELESTFNIGTKKMHGFLYWDLKYIRPFFTRRYFLGEIFYDRDGGILFMRYRKSFFWKLHHITLRVLKSEKKI